MRRVVINGQSYAVGLDWFPLKEDMKRAELVLEAEGYDEKCDLSVVLEKQYALARSRNRSWKRVRSLAYATMRYLSARGEDKQHA